MNVTDVVNGLDEILLVLNGKYDSLVEEQLEREDNGDSGYDFRITEVESQIEKIEEAKDILTWDYWPNG